MPSKIELTINSEYLPGWGKWEGIRELVQNAKDAASDGFPMSIAYNGSVLAIRNQGARLSKDALLLGTTSKQGRADQIGKFGEGLKLGVLALVRAGVSVTIYPGNGEMWRAKLQHSSKFDTKVLTFSVTECPSNADASDGVVVEISPFPEWQSYRKRFMFLNGSGEIVECCHGTLLLDKPKQLYVKGIYVCDDDSLEWGYDFRSAEVDRDRKMVYGWDMSWRIASIWNEAVAKRPELFNSWYSMLQRAAKDVQDFENGAASGALVDACVRQFTAEFGEKSVPVANLAEGHDMEHLGARPIVVTKAMAGVLQKHFGNREVLKQRLQSEAVAEHPVSELNHEERTALLWAYELLYEAIRQSPNETPRPLADLIKVKTYKTKDLLGQFDNGLVYIARHVLSDKWLTLHVLIHEICHANGGDGDKGHVWSMEVMWRAVAKHIFESKGLL